MKYNVWDCKLPKPRQKSDSKWAKLRFITLNNYSLMFDCLQAFFELQVYK